MTQAKLQERINREMTYRLWMGQDASDTDAIRAQCVSEMTDLARMVIERELVGE